MDEPNHNQLPLSVSASSSSSALSLSSSSNHWYPHPCSSSPIVALAEGELLQDDVEGVPRPLESLHSTPLPQFLMKIYELVQDPTLDRVLSWEAKGESFVVWDPVQLSRSILPQHFKHSNFSSFVRQLNTYGFRKTGTNSWEFANGDFRRGKKELLKNIRRRRSSSSLTSRSHVLTPPGTCYLTGGVRNAMVRKSRLDYEVETLTSEGDIMMSELAKLQEEHVTTRHKMESVRQRMQSAEQKQKRMVFLLWKVLQSAVIFPGHNHRRNHHLKHQSKTRTRIITSAEPTTDATWPHYETEDFVHFDTVTSKQLPDEDDNANVLQGILEDTIADASAETLKDIHVPEGGGDEDARLLLLSPLVGHMDDYPTDAAVAWREACNVMNSHGNDHHYDVSHNDDEYVSRGKSVLVYGEEEKEQEGMMMTRMTGGAASNGCDHTTFWSMNFATAQTPVIPRRLDVHDPAAPLEIEHEGCSSFTLPDDVWLQQQVDQMIWISENTEAGDFHCGS